MAKPRKPSRYRSEGTHSFAWKRLSLLLQRKTARIFSAQRTLAHQDCSCIKMIHLPRKTQITHVWTHKLRHTRLCFDTHFRASLMHLCLHMIRLFFNHKEKLKKSIQSGSLWESKNQKKEIRTGLTGATWEIYCPYSTQTRRRTISFCCAKSL